jgi:long-chain acyl-CoA synthetase
MLTHDNIASNVGATRQRFAMVAGNVALSFLPLSHIFERTGDYTFFAGGVSIAYAESIDTVPFNLSEVRPHYVMSVPRLFEKMYARVLEYALSGGPLKARIFHWAAAVADRWADEQLAGRTPGGLLAWQYSLAQKLVFSKLLARTGGRMQYFVSGGAPLAPSINKFFYAAGLTILEGYGLTETSPVIAVNCDEAFRIGSVGTPVAGVEVLIRRCASAWSSTGRTRCARDVMPRWIRSDSRSSTSTRPGDGATATAARRSMRWPRRWTAR